MAEARATSEAVSQDLVARRWQGRGFSCGLWVDPPGRTWEGYVHPVDELVMVVEGEVEFEVEGLVRRPAHGEELLIPARARHSVRNVGAHESRWLYGYAGGEG
ncbi:MAG TPA: cupin domain-containing protein [Anaeromyxobacter sp.]|nr:cupin domain-containing protein [Anaeromyxobacter sp.]